MPLKKPSELFVRNEKISIVEESTIKVDPEIDTFSQAFDEYKENLKNIETLSSFSESLNQYNENIEKIHLLSEWIGGIRKEIKNFTTKEDLERSSLAQLIVVENCIDSIEKRVHSINENYVNEIKTDVEQISLLVENFLDVDVPKYKNLILDSELRTNNRFDDFKININSVLESVIETVNQKYNEILESVDETNKEAFSDVYKELKRLQEEIPNYRDFIVQSELNNDNRIQEFQEELSKTLKEVQEKIESVKDVHVESHQELQLKLKEIDKFSECLNEITKHKDEIDYTIDDIKEKVSEIRTEIVINESHLKKQLKSLQNQISLNESKLKSQNIQLGSLHEEMQKSIRSLNLEELEKSNYELSKKIKYIEKFNEEKILSENIITEPPSTDNKDSLTPLDQNYVTLEQLQQHYRQFINRIQQQLSTLGGGGETRLKYLDDIVGIATNPADYDGKFLKYNHSIKKFEFVPVEVSENSGDITGDLIISGKFVSSMDGISSTSAALFEGNWFTGGTLTNTKPHFLIEPLGTVSNDWDISGTAFGINAPDGFIGNILDLKYNGVSQFKIDYSGSVGISSGTEQLPSIYFIDYPNSGFYSDAENEISLSIRSSKVFSALPTGNIEIYNNLNVGGDLTISGAFRALSSLEGVPDLSTLKSFTPEELDWVKGNASSVSAWSGVTYGNGVWIAVASSGTNRVMRTLNSGTTWDNASNTFADEKVWRSIAYGLGRFVAVGDAGATMNVASGTATPLNWTEGSSAPVLNWKSVTFGSDRFVAVGDAAAVMYSDDGITWAAGAAAPGQNINQNWRQVVYGDGVYVAVAQAASMYSTDGIEWTRGDISGITTQNWQSVTYGNGRFVAGGTSARFLPMMAYSDDGGQTWSNIARNEILETESTRVNFILSYGDGIFVALASNTIAAAYSENGIDWFYANSKFDNIERVSSVAHRGDGIDGMFIAVSPLTTVSNQVISLYDKNLVHWRPAEEGLPLNVNRWDAVLRNNDGWEAASWIDDRSIFAVSGGKYVVTSSDGTKWNTSLEVGENFNIGTGEYISDLGRFVVMGADTTNGVPGNLNTLETAVFYTDDFLTWQQFNLPFSTFGWVRIRAMGYGNGKLIALADQSSLTGAEDRILVSSDGVTWQKATFVPSVSNWRKIIWVEDFDSIGGMFFASAGSNTNRIIRSRDGLTWEQCTEPPFAQDVWTLAYSPSLGRLVCAGRANNIAYSDDGGDTWTNSARYGSFGNIAGTGLWIEELELFVFGSQEVGGYDGLSFSKDGKTFYSGSKYKPGSFVSNSVLGGTYPVHRQIWTRLAWSPSLKKLIAVARLVPGNNDPLEAIICSVAPGEKSRVSLDAFLNEVSSNDGGQISGGVPIRINTLRYKLPVLKNDNTIRIGRKRTIPTATSPGLTGEICWDDNYIYTCISPNTWKRSPLSTW